MKSSLCEHLCSDIRVRKSQTVSLYGKRSPRKAYHTGRKEREEGRRAGQGKAEVSGQRDKERSVPSRAKMRGEAQRAGRAQRNPARAE